MIEVLSLSNEQYVKHMGSFQKWNSLSLQFHCKQSSLSYHSFPLHQKIPASSVKDASRLVFSDLCAWQHSTGEIETSDLAFNGGEGGAVHLK